MMLINQSDFPSTRWTGFVSGPIFILGPEFQVNRLLIKTRKCMQAETLALLTKQLCFPNMHYCHVNTIILRIVLKLKNAPKYYF
jgi:hypothetical protein